MRHLISFYKTLYTPLLILVVAAVGYFSIHSALPTLIDDTTSPILAQILSLDTTSSTTNEDFADGKETAVNATESTTEKSGGIRDSASEVAAAAVAGCFLNTTIKSSMTSIASKGEVSYDVTITNNGNIACKNVTYTAYYSENQIFSSATPKPSSSNYYWRIGTLAPKANHAMKLSVKNAALDENDEMSTEICATADNGQDSCAAATVDIGAVVSAPPVVVPSTGPVVQVPLPTTPSVVTAYKEYGVWVWESPMDLSAARAEQVVKDVSANKFNAMYITIDDYVQISAMAAGSAKNAKKDAYFLALSKIITSAKAKGIAVDVVGGDRDWAIAENRWKGYALIDFVKEYNGRYPSAKIRGLEYDVEPYLLSTYETNKAGALIPFVEFIDESVTRMSGTDATLTVVIPHFYDSAQKWTPAISYRGKTKYTFTHLLDILERKPGSTITIMAYRNTFAGSNGTEQISKAEVQEASSGGYSTSVVIAQEVGDVEPEYVTFHGLTKNDLLLNVGQIQTGFKAYSRFGGVAIHYLDPFLELR